MAGSAVAGKVSLATKATSAPFVASTHESKPFDERRADIIGAARGLFESKGISRTSVKDITDAVGVTRGLFYYYFPDKDAVSEAVVQELFDEFVETVHFWNESRTRGDVEGAVKSYVRLLRKGLEDASAFRRAIAMTESTPLYHRFVHGALDEVIKTIRDTTVEEYARFHTIEIDDIYESFYVLIYGIMGLLKAYPETPDEVLVTIVEQSLHLDLSASEKQGSTGGNGGAIAR